MSEELKELYRCALKYKVNGKDLRTIGDAYVNNTASFWILACVWQVNSYEVKTSKIIMSKDDFNNISAWMGTNK